MTQPTHVLEHEGLVIRTLLTSESATLVWQGHYELRSPEAVLAPFFRELLPDLKGRKVTVDFRLFEYMNSATQAPILQMLRSLSRNQIATRVIYNAALEWQRISCRCMKILFRSMPQIQFECL